MKKTRKILSIVLAVLFAFSSMPVVYTGTAAADAVTYALGETGTLENPTRPVEASGSINRTDLYKLNINSQSTYYTFYQTKNDEYFTFGQTQGLQNYYETSVGSRTLTFESINFYEGSSGMDGSTEPKEISAGFGMWETPLITNNPTSEFLSKYYVESEWKSTNNNADGVGSRPENFTLAGSWADIGGCKVYTWQNDVIFKGNSAVSKGEINTGYYEQLLWNWVNNDATQSARFDLRIGTTIRVLDARELAKEIDEAEDILKRPNNYTKAYISSVEATLNTIPDDLRDFSKVYDQSEIDRYTQMLKDVSLNSADYTAFNQLYKNLKSINNSKGAYTDESFEAFKIEIAQINANLPKNLDKTKQKIVDDATQALRDAFNKLISKDVTKEKTPGSYTTTGASSDDGRLSVNLDNTAYYFMQTKDDQVFELSQTWTISRGKAENGTETPDIYGIVLDTANHTSPDEGSDNECLTDIVLSPNNTSAFISRLTSASVTQNTASDEKGNSVTNYEFKRWNEVDANGNDKSSTATDETGLFNPGRSFEVKENSSYYFEVTPQFKGMSSSESGETTYNFLQRMGTKFVTGKVLGLFGGTTRTKHFHFNTTVTITDVRKLVSAVEEANKTLANPGAHSDSYITALQAAVDSVPVEMLRGVEYYTQEEVDKLYNDITTIPENVADYSKFVETFEWMLAENKEKYTEESYNAFISEIYAINQNLPKNLTEDEQSTIDDAMHALYEAHDKLVSVHLNKDIVFTQDDLSELGNSPLEFSVSSTQYNFMQVADGQKFAIRTELTARNSKARYNCNLLALRFSTVDASTLASICEGRSDPDTGCHNGEAITLNQTSIVVGAVTGLNTYASVNDAGDIAEHNTWVNTEGVALSTNGVLNDPTTLSTSDSSAYAEMYYTGPTGNHEAYTGIVDATFAFRLGWSYYETVLGIAGESVRRHAHIPVNIKVTDARALNSLYEETDDILNGRTDKNYTFNSLLNLYNAFNNIDPDMAYGSEYFTQDEVNAAYADLKAAYGELVEGADYTEYFKAYVKAEEIINSNNTDSRGNALYDEETYAKFVETVTKIENELPKNLTASEENQATVDAATQGIKDALTELEATKRADYSDLNDSMTEAEKLLAEEQAKPGTYTQATIDKVQEAYDNAVALDKELPAGEQAQVDAITSALQAAIEDKEYKADYSEYDEAYNKVQDIIENPQKYTEETVKAAEQVMGTAGAIDKDLADTADNRQTIKDATDALNDVVNNAVEKADYSGLDEAIKDAQEIVNNPDKYTEETVKNAQDALDAAENLDKDLEKNDENQAIIDDVIQDLVDSVTNAKEKADYSGLDEAIKDAQEIVNNPDKYTEETVKNAQDALDAAENLDKDLEKNDENQAIIDDVIQDLVDSVTNAKEKADYSGLDEAIEEAEKIVNAPEGTYTDETVKNAQDALDAAESLDKDLPKSEQEAVDKVIQDLIDSATNAEEKADYTDYNNSKTEADNLVNDDGNGNPIYDEEAFQQYKDKVTEIDNNLDKDLSKTEENQKTVDDASQALKDLRTELDATKGAEQETLDPETTADSLKDKVIEEGGYNPDEVIVEFKNYLGEELAGEAFVGTGSTMRVILKSTGELLEYKLFIVMGDVDGDGDIDNDDYQKSMNIGLKKDTYAEEQNYFFIANDMSGDGYIDVLDCALIRRMF